MAQKTFNKRKNYVGKTFSNADEEVAFAVWYENNRPNVGKLLGMLPDGITPTTASLKRWKDSGDWTERGDELDSKVAKKNDKDLVKEKIEMVNRHRKAGRKMVDLALSFFDENTITSEHAAVRVLVEGAKLERQNAGMSALMETARDLSDEKLMGKIMAITEGVVDLTDDVSE